MNRASGGGLPAGRVLVLSEGENASLAYFVRPALAAAGAQCLLHDSRRAPPAAAPDVEAAVIVRYLPARWLPLLAALRRAGKPVFYFMDDDLMSGAAMHGLPWRYRYKIWRLARRQRTALETLCTDFLVSTPYLQRACAAWSPRLLAPCADAMTLPSRPAASGAAGVTVCYHGTASHAAEQQWLLPVVRALQESCPDTHFSIFGDAALARRFRDLPRVAVLHPMSWDNYLAWTSVQPCDIALAPLLPGPFNAARGATKFIDFARMGAVGIYADVAPYRDVVRDGIDGCLLPMDAAAWVDAIRALAADPQRRRQLADAARARALAGPLA